MKSWIKCCAFLTGLFCASAQADGMTPIADRDAFEKQIFECAMSGFKNNCIVPLFWNHVTPKSRNENTEKTVNKFNDAFQQLVKDTGVYKIHIVHKILKAEIYDDRIYLIQWKTGRATIFRIVFREILGKWYIANFELSDDEQDLVKLLNLKL